VLRVDSTTTPPVTRQEPPHLSLASVSLLDAGFEQVVIVPEECETRTGDIAVALDAAKELSLLWKSRNLPYQPPVHVLVFPTLIPRDLLGLSRSLDFEILNEGTRPKEMKLYDVEEAKKKFLVI